MKRRLLFMVLSLLILGSMGFFSVDSQAQSNGQMPPTSTATPKPTPPKDKIDEVIRIDTKLVMLTATVTDKNRRYRTNLKQSDFTVCENGVEQKLEYFNTGDRVPISLGIIFDTSGSMEDKIESVQDAVEHFVKFVGPGDEIFLVQFSDFEEIVQDFTNNKRRILRAVKDLEARGGTALYNAIRLGLQHVNQGKNRKRALLLLTDGKDTASSVKYEEALSLARKSEVIVYGFGIGHGERGNTNSHTKDTVDMRTLRGLADATGGNAYFLEFAHEGGRDLVDEAAIEVAAELKKQYTLGYYPTDKKNDGRFRQIRVEVKDKSLRVRTRRGYYR